MGSTALTPPRVLIVDAGGGHAEFLGDVLRTHGASAETRYVSWKDEDIRAAAEWADVVVCECGRTPTARLHPLETIVSLRADVPTVFLAAGDDVDAAARAAAAGATDVLLRVPGYLDQLPITVRQAHARAVRDADARLRMESMTRLIGEIEKDNATAQGLVAELQAAATTDALTGLANRRGFDQRAAEVFSIAARYDTELGVMVGDLDGLKLVNDVLGHEAGDEALRLAAATVRDILRRSDFAARVGGDEFAMLLPHTSAAGARLVAQRCREEFGRRVVALQTRLDAQHQARFGQPCNRRLGISLGISARRSSAGATLEGLLRSADADLYASKPAGRDRPSVETRIVSAQSVLRRAA